MTKIRGYDMSNDFYIQDDESNWMQQQQDDEEYAEYLFQLQRDDELLEKANKQLNEVYYDSNIRSVKKAI